MRNYLTGKAPVSVELIKNPAQSVHPAVDGGLLGRASHGDECRGAQFSIWNFPNGWQCFEGRKIITGSE